MKTNAADAIAADAHAVATAAERLAHLARLAIATTPGEAATIRADLDRAAREVRDARARLNRRLAAHTAMPVTNPGNVTTRPGSPRPPAGGTAFDRMIRYR